MTIGCGGYAGPEDDNARAEANTQAEAARRERAFVPLTGQSYRHKKTGNVYVVVLADCRIEATNTEAVAYRRADILDGVVWIRPFTEFTDGRFEPA